MVHVISRPITAIHDRHRNGRRKSRSLVVGVATDQSPFERSISKILTENKLSCNLRQGRAPLVLSMVGDWS